MPYYRLYFMAGEHIRDVRDFVCDDDLIAFRRAHANRDGRPMELWRQDQLLAAWEAEDPAVIAET